MNRFTTIAFAVIALAATAGADELQPRAAVVKPQRFEMKAWHRDDVISVKFADGLTIRLRDGRLTDLGAGHLADARPLLDGLAGGTWHRAVAAVPEMKLDQLRENAQATLGKAVADFNLRFQLVLPEDADAVAIIDAFNALDIVELAEPTQVGPPAPVAPNFQGNQGYHNAGPIGLNAYGVWEQYGARGAGVRVAMIDYNWNANHLDLPTVQLLGQTPPPSFNTDHGTACLGTMAALDDGVGTTGMANQAIYYFAGAELFNGQTNVWDVGAAILTTLATLQAGDVLLLEQQANGPAGLVPIEWQLAEYNAIVTAVGNGVIVIEPAGNGNQDLDGAIFSTGNGGHWPFLPQNDSGAIMVGAGAVPNAPGMGIFLNFDTDRSRLTFSNYGSTLDVQGWGEGLMTAGYGDAWGFPNELYTRIFDGTSAAGATVAGAVALIQSEVVAATGSPLTPAAMLTTLQASGAPQQTGTNPASQNIGPRPDAAFAIASVLGNCLPFYETGVGNTGLDDVAHGMTVFDDGNGADLYIGGEFATAGGTTVDKIARYDGTGWSAVGGAIGNADVKTLEVFDDGNGPKLYAGALSLNFNEETIATVLNGSTWTSILEGTATSGFPRVNDLVSFDDGNGAALYAAGKFTTAGGTTANNIAKWNGSSWSALGTGTNFDVETMEVFDDGNGDALYIGGQFNTVDGLSSPKIARWDGSTWSTLGAGIPLGTANAVWDMEVYDDGNGPDLYLAVQIEPFIWRWDGSQFTAVGDGMHGGGPVYSLELYDDGLGEALYAGGSFTFAGEKWCSKMAKWDGVDWYPLGDGIDGATNPGLARVNTMTVFDYGNGASLYLGGDFTFAWDLPTNHIVEWDGCSAPCATDTNGDNVTDVNDLVAVITAWGVCPPGPCPADVNGDGVVDVNDLVQLITQWGPCP